MRSAHCIHSAVQRPRPFSHRQRARVKAGKLGTQPAGPAQLPTCTRGPRSVLRAPAAASTRKRDGLQLVPFGSGPLSDGSETRFPVSEGGFQRPTGAEDSAPDASFDMAIEGGEEEDKGLEGLKLDNADLTEDVLDGAAPLPTTIADLANLRGTLRSSERYAWNTARCLQNMAYLGRSLPFTQRQQLHADPLMEEVVQVLDAHINQFTAAPLSMVMWSLAHLQFVPGRVMTKLLRAVDAQLDDLDSVQLVKVIWAFGKLSVHPGGALMKRLCDRVIERFVDLQPQGLANVAWACARLGECAPQLLNAIEQEVTARLESSLTTFTPQAASNTAWAFAKLKHRPSEAAFRAFERHMLLRFPEYSSQAMSLMIWSMAMHKRPSSELLDLVALEIKSCARQFSVDDYAAMVTAFAEFRAADRDTALALIRQCRAQLDDFRLRPGLLCSILWGLAVLKCKGARNFGNDAFPIIRPRLYELAPRSLANLVYAMGKLRIFVPPGAAKLLLKQICKKVSYLNGQQLANVAIGIADTRWVWRGDLQSRMQQLMRVMRQQTLALIESSGLAPREILHVLYSMLKMARLSVPFAIKVLYPVRDHLRNGTYTSIDVTQIAYIVGQWRGGVRVGPRGRRHEVVLDIVDLIGSITVEQLHAKELRPRHLASVVWMHGRMGMAIENEELLRELPAYIVDQTDAFNHIDVANLMLGFVASDTNPGMLVLDALAEHVNARYQEYGRVEMAQVMYAFAKFSFHPGAVIGRVAVVYNRSSDLFDTDSKRLVEFSLLQLHGWRPVDMLRIRKNASDEQSGDSSVL